MQENICCKKAINYLENFFSFNHGKKKIIFKINNVLFLQRAENQSVHIFSWLLTAVFKVASVLHTFFFLFWIHLFNEAIVLYLEYYITEREDILSNNCTSMYKIKYMLLQ